ncbi:hypothetical protein BI312_10430 [Xanthomonas citri pv. citri]|nr:hypothetical protein B7L66_17605 [Xanthomonas citri pv. citri]ARR16041.1 hypothetical protein B7L65_03155 [Xanthomonas citri pv. citri]ARR21725.1 hypothetical protein B7L67_09195 [Xanthomonas citri pv. citri]AUZ52684.1 hypothetical protein CLM98_20845 [Xanthomonas citri pv. citri]AYL22400.1 hypothetical protein COR42_20250 [Xanthomonas citri pv. citri]
MARPAEPASRRRLSRHPAICGVAQAGLERCGALAAQLTLAPAQPSPAEPAPRSTRSAQLAANASHLNVHHTL